MHVKAYEINSSKVISETLDGETIIINLESGNYFSMNKSGSAIWDAISKKELIPLEDSTVSAFINTLEKEELVIEIKNTAGLEQAHIQEFTDPHIEKYEEMREMLLADPIHDVAEVGWPKLKEDK